MTLNFRPVKRKFATKTVSDKIQSLDGTMKTLSNGLDKGDCVKPEIDPVIHLFILIKYVAER